MGKRGLWGLCVFGWLTLACSLSFAWPVPDTGQRKCYDSTGAVINCPEPGAPFYGQDSSYNINPPSFTRLDEYGNPLPESATSWAMVRDEVTGLIWEGKRNADNVKNYADPRDADNTYTWYDPNPATNGGDPGTPGDGTDTEDFIRDLNDTQFGGFSDWRLPCRKELRSIVHYGATNPAVDRAYFPYTKSANYWSSTTNANYPGYAWRVSFSGGEDHAYFKSDYYYVRAVRGGQ